MNKKQIQELLQPLNKKERLEWNLKMYKHAHESYDLSNLSLKECETLQIWANQVAKEI